MKKLISLVLALAMVLMVGAAFAADTVKIEISRDSSFDGADVNAAGNTYTYYKVFSATYSANTSTGGDANADGTPGDVTGTATAAAYEATAAVAAKLGSWVAASGTPGEEGYVAAHWQKATGNLWFTLTPIAGSTNYSVSWDAASTTSETAQAAAKWLKENAVYESTGSLTWNSSTQKWEKDNLDKGYYLIEGANGDNLIAATTDITVNEKNDYPPHKKEQADEDVTTYDHNGRKIAVGDVLNYKVSVTVPTTAKVGEIVQVWDKPTSGLSYNNDLTVTPSGAATAATLESGDSWRQNITVTDALKGQEVVFTFSMTVTKDALVDTGKMNESGLKYGREGDWTYESKPDHVEYTTYFAGIEKVDGQNTSIKLAGVEFTLKEGSTEFKVIKPEGKDYYVYDASGSSTVVTDANGLIKIRGLDGDKTYTLTETANPNAGYNLLAEPVTLTLKPDTITSTTIDVDGTETTETTSSYDGTTADQFDDVVNNKGTLLPSTGGIGTTIFYIVGGLLLVGAAIVLVARRKAND